MTEQAAIFKWNLTDVEGLVKSMGETHELLMFKIERDVLPIGDDDSISYYPPSGERTLTVRVREKP